MRRTCSRWVYRLLKSVSFRFVVKLDWITRKVELKVNYVYEFDLQRTVMLTSFVAAFPTPFSAVHLYNPSSCLPVMFNTLDTGLLSGTRVHLTVGWGLPSGVQFSCTTSVSFTILSWMMWVVVGGSENNQTKHLTLNDNKGKVLKVFCGSLWPCVLIMASCSKEN